VAKKSYKNNYPKLRWVLLLAIAISIPVTIWTFNTAPTETRSQAATSTCGSNGGGCYKYNCSTGFKSISGSCGNMTDSVCCTKTTLSKPSSLKTYYSYCKPANSTTTYYKANMEWYHSDMKYTTNYVVYFRKYNSGDAYKSASIPTSEFLDTFDPNYGNYFYKTTGLGRSSQIQWYVIAKNVNSGVTAKSDIKVSSTPSLSCP